MEGTQSTVLIYKIHSRLQPEALTHTAEATYWLHLNFRMNFETEQRLLHSSQPVWTRGTITAKTNPLMYIWGCQYCFVNLSFNAAFFLMHPSTSDPIKDLMLIGRAVETDLQRMCSFTPSFQPRGGKLGGELNWTKE